MGGGGRGRAGDGSGRGKMASEAQIAASRRNAVKSTGPRTERGKERSRLNAPRHGLLPHGAGDGTVTRAIIPRMWITEI